jgi:hypothetical protein
VSVPVSAETASPPSFAYRLAGLFAVAVARLLVMLPPGRLARVLRLISRGARPATHAQALRARQTAVAVSARCAGLGCMQRSVAAAVMCRMAGRWPDWCTGFRSRPFAAHAWVEVDGHPVGEQNGIEAFRIVLRVTAGGEA